jgi:hypothetical protein
MKLGIMQPYLFPYIGYWQLIKVVDTYVIYDDVTYIKGGWINRNNYLINGQGKLFTIRLKDADAYKLINEIEIMDDFVKFVKMIQNNYAKAPHFKNVIELIRNITFFDKSNLSLFIINSIEAVLKYLNIKTRLIVSSSLNKNNMLKGQDKVLDICKLLGSSAYYNAIGGSGLYDKEVFLKEGINLYFLKPNLIPYKQFGTDFIPALSIIDVMMFNSVEEINQMLDDFILV